MSIRLVNEVGSGGSFKRKIVSLILNNGYYDLYIYIYRIVEIVVSYVSKRDKAKSCQRQRVMDIRILIVSNIVLQL